MRCGPREPPRPSEVVKHEVRPADVERGEGTRKVPGVPADRVVETRGFVGAPEARHVERYHAPELCRRRGEARPILDQNVILPQLWVWHFASPHTVGASVTIEDDAFIDVFSRLQT